MITRAGWGLAAASVLVYAVGAPLGYAQAAVLALTGVAAVGAGALWTLRGVRLEVRREVTPVKVARGEPAVAILHVRNTGRWRHAGLLARDVCRGTTVTVEVPALARHTARTVSYRLPTRRRGETPVGPLLLDRVDPFGLARRSVAYGRPDMLLVRPRTVVLAPLRSGRQRHLDGLTSRSAPSGASSFKGLREYVIGDDLRHVHWRSTARTGTLMVKELTDVNLPDTVTILDTRPSSYEGDDEFELAVDVAASAACAVTRDRFPVRVLTGMGELVHAKGGPGEDEEVLDRLALVEREAAAEPPLHALRRAGSGGALVLVSGTFAALPDAAAVRRRFDQVLFVRVGDPTDGGPPRAAGVNVIEVADLEELAAAWPG
ncbi:Uncharacterized conserved protein, DUF58 family, contains vWF domain [Nonomuraea solani]|uniref:Uncharacterized conserved protein, DUF58 family, contains vWF domain n=1 Tax=Nonomuraea solani TaxID=1144553 RepID=A0A1H5UYA8_9ACTN|nr:DUF58 domain-containing protein [Nonomuraea solani]SEF79950.1 Uncharacterized conserved protein, DUF58 family, contains vWF domain [Nonomuraea solani]